MCVLLSTYSIIMQPNSITYQFLNHVLNNFLNIIEEKKVSNFFVDDL